MKKSKIRDPLLLPKALKLGRKPAKEIVHFEQDFYCQKCGTQYVDDYVTRIRSKYEVTGYFGHCPNRKHHKDLRRMLDKKWEEKGYFKNNRGAWQHITSREEVPSFSGGGCCG